MAVGIIGVAPAATAADASYMAAIDTSAVTSTARAQLTTAPVVSATADAVWTADAVTVSAEAPPPPPPPPAPVRTTTTTPAPKYTGPVPVNTHGSAVVEIAMRYLGAPYVWGAEGPDAFDCSGLVKYVYGQLGVYLPHQSEQIKNATTIIPASEAQAGDLIWFPGHIAIYAGDGMIIDAAGYGNGVVYRQLYRSDPTYLRVG
jgi:cell wall-associated NlpC family hydrolase